MIARYSALGLTNEEMSKNPVWVDKTGNGNDLVLSNFGFAEGSGYGLYAYNFNSFELRDNVVKPTDVKKDSFRIIGIGDNGNVLVLSNTSNSAAWKIRITGMKEGDSCIVGNANKSGDYIKIIKDGIYTFQKQYAATSINGIWYNSSQEVDVLVEQIPEYEGYLITDGVDDEIISTKLIQFADKFTIVGDWKFMEDRNDNAGLLKANQIYIYKGHRYQYGGDLWEVLQGGHKTQENWKPSLETASLWKRVDEEHAGTKDDPIPYAPPMEIFKDKYYTQSRVLYKCIRDSGQPLSHNLSDLVGNYVEKA